MIDILNIDRMEDSMCDKVVYYQINGYDMDIPLSSSGWHWDQKLQEDLKQHLAQKTKSNI